MRKGKNNEKSIYNIACRYHGALSLGLPGKVVVVKKDTERLVEQVRENSSEEEQDAAAVNTLAEKLGVPDRFFAENVYSDTFSMKADAEIVLPAAEKLPTVRVIPADFSQNTVDRLYDYLVGDTVM